MGMAYSELLLDPRWQRRRLECLSAANWACLKCRATDRTLHVHHVEYRRGAMPWEYPDELLQVLCVDCHAAEPSSVAAMRRDGFVEPHEEPSAELLAMLNDPLNAYIDIARERALTPEERAEFFGLLTQRRATDARP